MKLMRILHISLLFIFITSSFFFSKSNGFVLKGNEKGIYVSELLSSGSNDNTIIEFSAVLFVPLILLSLFRIKKAMVLFEYISNIIIFLLQISLLFLIEAGSIINTVIHEHNKALSLWIMSFFILICLTQFFYFSKKKL